MPLVLDLAGDDRNGRPDPNAPLLRSHAQPRAVASVWISCTGIDGEARRLSGRPCSYRWGL